MDYILKNPYFSCHKQNFHYQCSSHYFAVSIQFEQLANLNTNWDVFIDGLEDVSGYAQPFVSLLQLMQAPGMLKKIKH